MLQAIKGRRSIRKFKPDIPVLREQLDTILESAMLAPSSRNCRPWEFVAITDRTVCDKIGSTFANYAMCNTATAVIVVVAVPQKGVLSGLFSQDCAAATQNILLAAYDLGLGSCWCAAYPYDDRTAFLRELLDIEQSKIPFCIVALGTPAESPMQRGYFDKDKVKYID